MKVFQFPLGQLQANCYFLIKENTCLIIDPADEASFLLEEIQRRRFELVGMVATHGHFDHVMAVGEIQMAFANVSFVETSRQDASPLFYIHPTDVFLLNRLGETARYFLGYDPQVVSPQQIEPLQKGDFSIGNFSFQILHTPGHTPGSCCLYFKKEGMIFTGDTLFQGSIGRYDFSYSSKIDLFESLQRLFTVPEDTKVYPGHGEGTSIGEEKSKFK